MKKFGFGLMRLPLLNPDDPKSIDIEAVKSMVDEFMGNGFTYYDTAMVYNFGFSEIAFREAVAKRYPRDSYTITDKLTLFAMKSPEEMPDFFAGQLERLGVDYIDYYWIHAMGGLSYPQALKWGAFDFLKGLKDAGKVRHIGFSYHDKPELLDQILTEHPEMEYVQLQLNYLDWEDPAVEAKKCYEVATKHGKPVIVMEPVKGGVLASPPKEADDLLKSSDPNLSSASWAIGFAASQDNVMMVLSGMSDIEQVRNNVSYMKNFVPLTEEERALTQKAAGIIRASIAIPCTGCRYCTAGCPKKICIPDYFSLYNAVKRFGQEQQAGNSSTYYLNLAEKHGAAGDCIKCGKCEKTCPQHLKIREYLEDVAAMFETGPMWQMRTESRAAQAAKTKIV